MGKRQTAELGVQPQTNVRGSKINQTEQNKNVVKSLPGLHNQTTSNYRPMAQTLAATGPILQNQ